MCHFPIGILGQVWYLIVSIPDLCTFTYFYGENSDFLISESLLKMSFPLVCFWHFIISYLSLRSMICTLVCGFMVIRDKSVSPIRVRVLSTTNITPGSANFGILIKKKIVLVFCLIKECRKLLCGLDNSHRRRQTIQMWNSLWGGGGILQGITVFLVSAVLSIM